MTAFNKKLIISASAVAATALLFVGCAGDSESAAPAAAKCGGDKSVSRTYANGKKVIDGGITYNEVQGKVGPYYVNEAIDNGGYSYGRTPTENELEAWNTTVTPWRLPPEGEGTAEEGEAIYEAQCVMCHGDFGSGGGGYPSLAKGSAYDLQKSLKNQRLTPDSDGPVRVFGTYWPEASTLWWYIMEGMPHPKTRSLTDDQTYALTAYILYLNEMEIDGEEVDEEYVLNQESFSKIVMPNKDGFEPVIAGPDGLENTRAYYDDPKNFGAQMIASAEARCMKDCQEPTVKVKGIMIEQKDFLPPLSQVRDLPPVENTEGIDMEAKNTYETSCAVCHGAAGMGAPVVGDKAAWETVVGKGMDTVYANAINGVGGMPPKGGTDLDDDKLKAVVDYMIDQSK